MIHELASQPALARIKEAIDELVPDERELAVAGPAARHRDRPEPARLRARRLPDPRPPRRGRRVRLDHRRRARARRADRAAAGARRRARPTRTSRGAGARWRELDAPPAGALLFTCNGRGRAMFAAPDHDARLLDDALRARPPPASSARARSAPSASATSCTASPRRWRCLRPSWNDARRMSRLTCEEHRDDGMVRLALTGEFDLSNAAQVRTRSRRSNGIGQR